MTSPGWHGDAEVPRPRDGEHPAGFEPLPYRPSIRDQGPRRLSPMQRLGIWQALFATACALVWQVTAAGYARCVPAAAPTLSGGTWHPIAGAAATLSGCMAVIFFAAGSGRAAQ